jgi:hypothetical protein
MEAIARFDMPAGLQGRVTVTNARLTMVVQALGDGTAGTAALMMDEVLRGKPGYEWTVNHVLPVADPLELFTVKLKVVGG